MQPEHLIPSRIWQIMPLKSRELEHTRTWLALNKGYIDKRGYGFLKWRFGNTSDIFRAYDNPHNVGMRSDFLRYLLLEAEGGAYTETNTIALKPIDSWTPSHLRDNTRLVIGTEYDQRDGRPWEVLPRPLHFAQWTIASAPGHPMLHKMAARVVVSAKDLARQ
ncbi:initiation-specific alpha- -mannosyltransferase [Colletotrichum incanum]|uniref:Initiation-specific alpha--mannosyltransferase n=1 Tax=Colletotrichum incanum TaxID=1573173 RepID=A0A167CKM6_COLIC|nr:initiation-specific alpha- -mannosyltransferase [Colletotrichum incanum]OHW89540.1 initiation-specific alpha-mannosyltransferase [Colletotrichum incanum]